MPATSFLDEAIQAHAKWKIRLLTAVNGGETPDRATAAADNQCALGQWIHGEGARHFATSPDFDALRSAHARFHAYVGRVIDLLHTDRVAAKEAILSSEYSANSTEVVRAITALKRQRG